MKRLFSSPVFRAFVFILAALFTGAVLSAVTATKSSPFSSAFGLLLSPVQKASAYVSEKLTGFGISFESSSKYREEIDELRKRISDYEKKLVDYEQTKQKLDSYSVMLDVKEENEDFVLEPANIIGRDALDSFGSFIIDKGSLDSVSVNDPVVYGNYVVGVVYSVKKTYSQVRTILNPKVNISAIESRTRESGYTTTTAELALDGKCMLSGLDKNTNVAVGGIVCTSGIGGVYPKGLIIGRISEVAESRYDISVNAVITPSVDISELEDVFVITDFAQQGITD